MQKNIENITYTYPCYRYLWNLHPFIFSRDNHCGIFLVYAFIILLYTSDFINVCGLLMAFYVLKYTACIFTQYYVFEIYPFSVLPQYCLHPETPIVVCSAASYSSLWLGIKMIIKVLYTTYPYTTTSHSSMVSFDCSSPETSKWPLAYHFWLRNKSTTQTLPACYNWGIH